MREFRRITLGSAVVLAALGIATTYPAFALQGLPSGGQVNNDPAAGIDRLQSIGSEDPANADVVGGALTAGKVLVPWAVFRQQEASGAHDQIFSRSFAAGAWTTRGSGTVGGNSSASLTFPGSLNFDQGQDGGAPAIDFAGSGRTVPWATWYENTTGIGFGNNNIFVGRFDNTGDATQGKWLFSGQGRGNGGTNNVPVPSLNIHTDQDAENPSVAGGTTTPGGNPGPWVTWQETSVGGANTDQIFISRSLGPGLTDCDGVTPAGVVDGTGHVPAIGGFCWQQTGIDRVAGDPSLNVDTAREGIEPDIAFTGAQDTVPWVVWYETGTPGAGLQGPKGMVFAAKGVTNASADGGFEWVAVGNGGQGNLDASINGAGTCAVSLSAEQACSLNIRPTADAEDPRVASGTMNPANPTVPWVAWDEDTGTQHQVFVSRLVGAGAAARFVPVNNGQPISPAGVDATRPEITFSGNTPYVTFRLNSSGASTASSGHFVNAANPTFVTDNSNVPLTSNAVADVREPISSGCTANPFNADGATCQGGAVGTPFFLFTNGTSPRGLFADAYQPETPVTGTASAISASSATLSGSVNPEGAPVNVSFQYGTTSAYGQATTAQAEGPGDSQTSFSAAITGLPQSRTIHYRAVVSSDFVTLYGADQTLTTTSSTSAAPTPVAAQPVSGQGAGKATIEVNVSGTKAAVRVSCGATARTCRVALKLTVTEKFKNRKLISLSASSKTRTTRKVLVVGSAKATLKGGQTRLINVVLNQAGKRLLKSHHILKVRLRATQINPDNTLTQITSQILTFKSHRKHRR